MRQAFIMMSWFALALPAAAQTKPNILFIMADDLGWADLGCYGNRFNETPHLDRLAREGVRCTNFYASAPVCSPTRAAIMSGQFPARLGLTAHIPGHWRPFEKVCEPPCALQLPLGVETLAECLKASGYATGHFGKWHLGGVGFGPKEQGFSEAHEVQGHTVPGPRQIPPGKGPRRAADYLANKAISFLEQHRDRPFYLQIHPYAVHIPLDTTPELLKKYEAKPKVPGYSCLPVYAGLLEELDSCVGRILVALDRLKLRDSTIVVFTSDNGGLERESGGWPGTSNRPLRDEKGTLYEGGIRIPTMVRWPGVSAPNSIQESPAQSIDFYPTLVEAAGARFPSGHVLDGISLKPVWQDARAQSQRPALFWHYPHYHHSRPSSAIRKGDWKMIEFLDTGETELYNLALDESEAKNLVKVEEKKANELKNDLKRWRLEVTAQMPQPNPAYDAKRAGEWWNRRTVQPTEAPGTYKPAK